MASVRPFHAVRYHVAPETDMAALLAPPYDVINAEQQQALYDRDPHNVIRLEYGLTSPADSDVDNRYTRARDTLQTWRADGTLTMDQPAAFYPHTQRYLWQDQVRERRGFFAAVELQPFDAGQILPHEHTLKGPKVDRLKLMQTCQASFSPVFGLYDGRDSGLGELLAAATARAPQAQARNYGFDETLWRTDDTALTAGIAAALRERKILIADGHHRYETMLALRDLLREQYPDAPATAAFNYVLMLLVDLNDPGLLVLPTHRLLLLSPEMQAAFCRVAGMHNTLEQLSLSSPDDVTPLLAAHRDEHAFVWYNKGRYTLLTSPKSYRDNLPQLDVTVLQERLLDPLFCLDPESQACVEQNIRYTIHPTDAVTRADRGEVDGAIFLNPTPVHDVLLLAEAGIRLPQKSTYFYPKVPTGLVMHDLRPDVTVG